MISLIRLFPLFAFVLPVIAGDDPFAVRDPQGVLSRHPYVQMPTQTSAVIVWRTNAPTLAVLSYGPAPDQLNSVVFPTQMTIKLGPDVVGAPDAVRLHSAPIGTYQYEALITGLQPDTKVYYSICDGTDLLAGADEDHFFFTLPVVGADKPMRLWVVGDSGNGSLAQIDAYEAMRSVVATEGRPVDHYIHVGDMAYNIGLDTEFQANFFNIYGELLRNTTVWPAMGNHEGYTSRGATGIGPYYDAYALPKNGECGGVASGTEAYYSFDIGKVHFVVLNSYDLPRVPTGAMAQWLQADLEQATADWLIAFWHHPPYTKGTHNSDTEIQLVEMRRYLLPILESAGVDLTLTGHSHIYERSMLVDGAYSTPTTNVNVVLDDGDGRKDGHGSYIKSEGLVPNEGSLHVVAGNGRSAGSYYGISPIMRETIAEVGSVLVDIDGDELHARMLNLTGEVKDWFTLRKTGVQPARAPLTYPWSPVVTPDYRTFQRDFETVDIVILPNPPAPDAQVYFTTDGSEPDASSTLFETPVTLVPGTTVKVMTSWRNGSRESPVSSFTVPLPGSQIRLPVLSGDNDGVETSSGTVVLDESAIRLPLTDSVAMTGIRFEDLRVSKGARVTEAAIQFTAAAVAPVGTSYAIRAEQAPDSAPFLPVDFNFSTRTFAPYAANWDVLPWPSTGVHFSSQRTADLSVLLQMVICQENWQSGNAVSFFFEGNGDFQVSAFEGGVLNGAELIVRYDPTPSAGLDQAGALRVGGMGGSPQDAIQLVYRRVQDADVQGIEYVIEISPDLSPGSWDVFPVSPSYVCSIPGTEFEDVYFLGIPSDETMRYFRLKVISTE